MGDSCRQGTGNLSKGDEMSGNYHHEITDPVEIHEEKNARDAKEGTVLRFNGLGAGLPAQAYLGVETVSMVGTSVAITQRQASAAVLVVNGNLSADSSIVVPDSYGPVIVVNQTIGAFVLTIKTALGTGVALANGKAATFAVVSSNVMALTPEA